MRKSEYGFTLSEILVTIAIIGVLAAIAIPLFLNQKNDVSKADVEAYLLTSVTPIEMARNASGGYYPLTAPESIQGRVDAGEISSTYHVSSDQLKYCLEAANSAGKFPMHILSTNPEPKQGLCSASGF